MLIFLKWLHSPLTWTLLPPLYLRPLSLWIFTHFMRVDGLWRLLSLISFGVLKPLLLFSFVLMTASLNWFAMFVPELMRVGDLPVFCILKLWH